MRGVLQMAVVCTVAGWPPVWAGNEKDGPAKKDLKGLQGVWTVESAYDRGEKVPADKFAKLTITFKGDKATSSAHPDDPLTIKLDPEKKPAAIDLIRDKMVALGVYELDGDTLKLCYADFPVGKPRPKGLVSTKENKGMLFVLKRKK
jgi:uncharacterized protein (TIGR03067 family)